MTPEEVGALLATAIMAAATLIVLSTLAVHWPDIKAYLEEEEDETK
jgi:hypothetical protein